MTSSLFIRTVVNFSDDVIAWIKIFGIISFEILKFTPNLANILTINADVVKKLGQQFFLTFLEISYDFLVLV